MGIFSFLTILTSKAPVEYAMFNPAYNGEKMKDSDLNVSDISCPEILNMSFCVNTAISCIDLVRCVYKENKHDIPGCRFEYAIDYKGNKAGSIGYIWSNDNVIFVSFRGTMAMQEWMKNLKTHQTSVNDLTDYASVPFFMVNNPDIMVHSGVFSIYKLIFEYILKCISSITRRKGRNMQVLISGHSLGGALSTLLACDCMEKGFYSQAYIFGSPKVGNPALSSYVSRNKVRIFRVENTEDIAVSSPMSVSPNTTNHRKPYLYSHCGSAVRFTKNNMSLYNNHSMDTYYDEMLEFKKLS